MANYDYFSNFIQGLQMGQSMVNRQEEKARQMKLDEMQKETHTENLARMRREGKQSDALFPYQLSAAEQAKTKGEQEALTRPELLNLEVASRKQALKTAEQQYSMAPERLEMEKLRNKWQNPSYARGIDTDAKNEASMMESIESRIDQKYNMTEPDEWDETTTADFANDVSALQGMTSRRAKLSLGRLESKIKKLKSLQSEKSNPSGFFGPTDYASRLRNDVSKFRAGKEEKKTGKVDVYSSKYMAK